MAFSKTIFVDNQTVIEAAQLNAIQDELIRVGGLLGKDIQSATINDSGHLILTLTDGTTLDAGVAKGTQGATGPAGDKGEPGATGKSAYQYAQEGGYTGTEAAFAERMAAEIPAVDATLTQSGKAADAKAVGDALANVAFTDVFDTAKYGITAADYVAPFTASMYEVAYANGVGIQNAINDAKAKGMERITLPSGNYPLCYHATADDEYNAIIDASGIDFYGYGVKLYVIYDEEGTNPYFTGETPRLLQGTIIKTDRDVRGFHLVGERRFRKDVNTKYRDSSKGIGLTSTVNGNTIKDCLIECVSGDGIGNETYMEQLAGWDETFTSIEWDYSTGAYVESNYKFVSAEHGGDWIDKTRPLLIRCSVYFLYSSAPLIIRCWDSDGAYIGVVQFWQGEYFYLPENTAKWRLELTRIVEHETTATETWSFWLGYGTYSGTKIINCESRLNQRGGVSNPPNDALFKNCYIHNNGNDGDGMVAYYDSTRFGIDVEDIWIHNFTIAGCHIVDNLHSLLFRCGSAMLKQSIISSIYSINFTVDFFAEQCVLGDVNFYAPTTFGTKLAIGCTFSGAVDESVKILDLSGVEARMDALEARMDALPVSLNTNGLVKHLDFTADNPMVDKVTGEVYTTNNGSELTFDENGGYATAANTHVVCAAFDLASAYTVEVVWHKKFGQQVFATSNGGNALYDPEVSWLDYPKIVRVINKTAHKFTQYEKDGEIYSLYDANLPKIVGDITTVHLVFRCDGENVSCKMNGYDLLTADGSKTVAAQALSVSYIARYLDTTSEGRLKEVRYYDRAMTDEEVKQAYRYQKQKDAGIANDASGSEALKAATSDTLGGVKADPATEADTQPVRIGTDGKLYTAEGGGGGINITGATVGQIAKITAVDASGAPTAWAPVDMLAGVPSVTAADNGKFLRVVSGAWAASEISSANGVSF